MHIIYKVEAKEFCCFIDHALSLSLPRSLASSISIWIYFFFPVCGCVGSSRPTFSSSPELKEIWDVYTCVALCIHSVYLVYYNFVFVISLLLFFSFSLRNGQRIVMITFFLFFFRSAFIPICFGCTLHQDFYFALTMEFAHVLAVRTYCNEDGVENYPVSVLRFTYNGIWKFYISIK